MPDVNAPPPCDSLVLGPGVHPCTAGPAMDLEPCLNDLPRPLSGFRDHNAPPYPLCTGRCLASPRFNSNALLTNLGFRHCPTNGVRYPLTERGLVFESGLGRGPDHPIPCGRVNSDGGTRLYRSMENLNWTNTVSEPDLYASPYSAHYRGSMDSELIFRCTATSHWYDGAPEGFGSENLSFYPHPRLGRRALGGLVKKELPLFPQWLLPGVDDWRLNVNARKGLKEKLRLHSARASVEPQKPLRPHVIPHTGAAILGGCSERDTGRQLCVRRITSPEEIKREVLRRLQLRRQNSSPNLSLNASPDIPVTSQMAKSHTAESISITGCNTEVIGHPEKPPAERLHIPTFQEFKRMRQSVATSWQRDVRHHSRDGEMHNVPSDRVDCQSAASGETEVERGNGVRGGGDEQVTQVDSSLVAPLSYHPDLTRVEGSVMAGERLYMASPTSSVSAISHGPSAKPTVSIQTTISTVAICIGPTPRSPLQASSQTQGEGKEDQTQAQDCGPSGGLTVKVPFFPPRQESSEGSSCCPALLLDSYGAKIYSMKDGLIGSALDLIKKSCSAEISAVEAPIRLLSDQDDGTDITAPPPDCQSFAISMTTAAACGAEACDKPASAEELAAECPGSFWATDDFPSCMLYEGYTRIFLDVSQNDNTALRRMNLRSFLMAPLQRVTKYPLLLSRISKSTTECHPDHARLREAKSRVESHLEHINMKTKQEGTLTWSLRSFRRDSRKNREVINIEMREMSMKTVGWARENTRFVMEGPLQLSQPTDGQWVKKGSKGLKFQNVQSLLMVRTQRPGEGLFLTDDGGKVEQQEHGVWDGVLVLIKDKSSGKFTVLRDPIRLANCVVSADPDCEDTFEVLDIRKEAFVFRALDKSRTQQWFRQIKRYARDLGPWRKRRNALPNIMMNTTQGRS
ncbi:hypothetical protein DPEC_G00041740 [Dallia pectoralis]|uniref:Uncharacterized protein n=1 Tax=Dallia pectoralis TaxID=75939 RepID=A0ACC2H9B9_DALPE|nr:hypothetical protein DPEC_G00041740 [Dallia pectoralis]